MTPANVLSLARNSLRIGIAEFKGMYTLPAWIFGWLLRVVFQVFFFSLVGRLIGSSEQVRFLLVGGAILAAALEAMVVVMSATDDRSSGMLAMLATTPGSYFVVYVFRHLNYLGTGLATSTFALFLGSWVMGVDLHLPRALLVVPLIALGAATCYAFAAFIGALTARAAQAYWLSLNVSYLSLMALSGFTIPLGSWPAPLVWLAQVLPFTHGLQAIRSILGDTPDWPVVLGQVGLETLLLLAWLGLAWLAVRTTIERARRNGDIDLPT
jgi:ABC-2 type transport system permease protein